MAARVENTDGELPVVDVDTTGKTSEASGRIQYTIEQLLHMNLEGKKANTNINTDVGEATAESTASAESTANAPAVQQMQLEDEKTDIDASANVGNATVETEASTLEVKQPKKVAFATVTEDPEDDPIGETSVLGDKGLTVANSKEQEGDKPKKKKKKKSSGKNKLPNPTGFEEFYADPPITPDEYLEEQQVLYSPELSFVERIETCIQRYRARRKFDAERSNIFTKYMILGGVDAGLKPFSGGLDKNLLATADKDEIAKFAATDYVGSNNAKFYNAANPKHWVVDFEGVVKGFLSHKAPHLFTFDNQHKIAQCCGVIRNFLNYVILHGVCPEYTEELMRSKIICDKAEKELWAIHELGRLLPDSFNIACSSLYGSYFKNMYIQEDSPWKATQEEKEEYGIHIVGMPENEAQRILKTAIALVGTEEMFRGAASGNIHVVKVEIRSFEIVEIIRADEKVKVSFAGAKDIHGKAGGIKPLGIMRVKHWDNQTGNEEDGSDDGTDAVINHDSEEFWIDDDVLEKCFIGLKMQAKVHELNIGLKYFDTVSGMYCSFFTVLPQEQMESWKEPVLNTRGPPTVDNPGAAEDEILEDDGLDADDLGGGATTDGGLTDGELE